MTFPSLRSIGSPSGEVWVAGMLTRVVFADVDWGLPPHNDVALGEGGRGHKTYPETSMNRMMMARII